MSGGTKWYLSEDCLLAAKRVMYTVEYRRFYLRDLESIVVWPNAMWLLRPILSVLLFALLGLLLWPLWGAEAGLIFGSLSLLWAGWELALGPTARTRVRTTGATVDLAIVARTRRAGRVLAKIDAAVRAARGETEQPAPAVPAAQPALSPKEAAAPIGDLP
jgi:hypothetical protein